jgi:hypothetical protein
MELPLSALRNAIKLEIQPTKKARIIPIIPDCLYFSLRRLT